MQRCYYIWACTTMIKIYWPTLSKSTPVVTIKTILSTPAIFVLGKFIFNHPQPKHIPAHPFSYLGASVNGTYLTENSLFLVTTP